MNAILSQDPNFNWEKDRGDLLFSDGLALRFYNSAEEGWKEEDIERKVRELLSLRKK